MLTNWLLGPLKEILKLIFNLILAPYVENLDLDQLNYGLSEGQLTLSNLRLKKSALQKFNLPVEILEGHLGTFSISLHWTQLGKKPVEILVQDLYVLLGPAFHGRPDQQREEELAQAAKFEKLRNAELLEEPSHVMQTSDGSPQSQGYVQALLARIINNLQITVKNVHVRYEDALSISGHFIAVGATLSEVSTLSVDENWQPAFIESTAGAVRKLGNLESLAVYLDTDTLQLSECSSSDIISHFASMIPHGATEAGPPSHRFILAPVSGQGKMTWNHTSDPSTPRLDFQLSFDDISFSIDRHQYHDVLSIADMYNVYDRRRKYAKFRSQGTTNKANWAFAIESVKADVANERRKWTWAFFAERRDDRKKYFRLYSKHLETPLTGEEFRELQRLEEKLSYEDLRLYRGIVKSTNRDLVKNKRKKHGVEDAAAQKKPSWSQWLGLSSSSTDINEVPELRGPQTEEERQELYSFAGLTDVDTVHASYTPKDAATLRVSATLQRGSFSLKGSRGATTYDLISAVFEVFHARFLQRPDSFVTTVALAGLAIHDKTTAKTAFPQIVQVKDGESGSLSLSPEDIAEVKNPLFFLRFEHHPLDGSADNALLAKMRPMEIIYHRGYVEAIVQFFKPPASQLESLETLLNVAGQQLDGLTKETRLSIALETHKTINLQMDLSAPVIIIPQNISTLDSPVLIVDAGHISIESELAERQALRSLLAKRHQDRTEEERQSLLVESYDRVTVRLEDAQFVLGPDLQSSRAALTLEHKDPLHLLERVNITLLVERSIAPDEVDLPQFKVKGRLPELAINFSDSKYKAIMSLVQVAIPRFDEPEHPPRPTMRRSSRSIALLPLPFGLDSPPEDLVAKRQSLAQDPSWKQTQVLLTFEVEKMQIIVSKTHHRRGESLFGEITLSRFALNLSVARFDMNVHICLRSFDVDIFQKEMDKLRIISSQGTSSSEVDLLKIVYQRVNRLSPDFETIYSGVEQGVDVNLSTFIVRASPEPVIMVYDFVMNTFVPNNTNSANLPTMDIATTVETSDLPSGKIRARISLASFQVFIISNELHLATLELSTANVDVLLHSGSISLTGRLGSLELNHKSPKHVLREEFQQIVSIQGGNFADFKYETCDPHNQDTLGFSSSISLDAASFKIHFLEGPLHDIYIFLLQLAKLKGIYAAATEAATQRAAEMNLVKFKVSIRSPLIVVPFQPASSPDKFVLRLGSVSAENVCKGFIVDTSASLHGIGLVSEVYEDHALHVLDIIGDINVSCKVTQMRGVDRSRNLAQPDTQIVITISSVDLSLTHNQYVRLFRLAESILRVFQVADTDSLPSSSELGSSKEIVQVPAVTGLSPNPVPPPPGSQPWVNLDLAVTISVVKLHLYDEGASTKANLDQHGIMRFALSESSLRFKLLSDGALEAQVILKSFVMGNRRPGASRFRQITASQSERNQFMVLYTQGSSPEIPALLVVSVDAPRVIFAVDPIVALIAFFSLRGGPASPPSTVEARSSTQANDQPHTPNNSARGLDVRMDLLDVSFSVIENEDDADSHAMRLTVRRILLARQTVATLLVEGLSMSLLRMGKTPDEVYILDSVDMTCALDARSTSSHQTLDLDVSAKPIVFRASYRDIRLISSLVTRSLELIAASGISGAPGPPEVSTSAPSSGALLSLSSEAAAQAFISTQKLKVSSEGISFVLIGDLNEQPMVHFKLKPFVLTAKDWSSQLHATTTIATQLRYFNLSNSHWEPLIDPWTFTVMCTKGNPQASLQLSLTARERLDVNLSSTFAELAITTLNTWTQVGKLPLDKPRGIYAPYRIRNRTGLPISIWRDTDGREPGDSDNSGVTIMNGQTVDWRFDDWKTLREHGTSTVQHNIGLHVVDRSWDHVRGIPVDRVGEYTFIVKSRLENRSYRLICDVQVEDHTKVVTIRSAVKIHNLSLYTLEVTLVDHEHRPVSSLEKLPPGHDFAVPVEMVGVTSLRLQPDEGFGYKWSQAINLAEIAPKRGFNIKCLHSDPREAPFHFQGWVQADFTSKSSSVSPKIDFKIRAPMEVENLLPFNIQYRLYDKNSEQNWRSYLRQGGVMPIHSVELGHLVLLNIEIEDTVFKPSEFAIINTDGRSEFAVESKISLVDSLNRRLDLRLNYIRHKDSGGAFKVQIYSPYIIINKTNVSFKVKCKRVNRPSLEVAGDTRPEVLSSATPFLLSHSQERQSEFIFQIADSGWSKPLNIEAPSAESSLVTPLEPPRKGEIHIGASWTEGLGKYKLTKILTLTPRFFLKNEMSQDICIREHGVGPGDRSLLRAGERIPFLVVHGKQRKLLTLGLPGLNAEWTAPFVLDEVGTIHIRMKRPNTHEEQLIKCDILLDGPSLFAVFSDSQDWPFRIDNNTDFPISLAQLREQASKPSDLPLKPKFYPVPPHGTLLYAWDYPASSEKRVVLRIADFARVVDMKEIGDLLPFKFLDKNRRSAIVSLDVRAEGPAQVLNITNYNPEQSVYRPTLHSANAGDSTSSLNEPFEPIAEDMTTSLLCTLDLAGIGLSLINKQSIEVVYASITGLKVEYSTSPSSNALHIHCASLQVDNQLHEALYPVIIQPTPVAREHSGVAALPTVQASMVWLNDQGHGVFFVKYFSILLQALTIEADEDLLFTLYELSQIQGVSWDEEETDKLDFGPAEIQEPARNQSGQDFYFEVLELQPVKMSLSFMRTERVTTDQKLSIRNPLAVLVNALTMAVGNVNDAILEFNALGMKDMRLTMPDLQARILYHYRQDVIRQLYRLLGSADFIGNPVGLFTNVSSGVADIFYEPFNGVVMHGNKELGIGIAKGAASFFKKTVFGVSDSFTKFTSSLGKGLSAATFDAEYQARRRMAQRRNKPRHAIYGVAAGGEALATSLSSAVEGILLKPMEGADREGPVGFIKGFGKGVVGAVTKPVVGVFDLAANVSEGIRNTTVVFDRVARDRVRLPRHVSPDGVLRSYSAREAQGQYWMRDLDNGAFRQEHYVAHMNSPGGDKVWLLTMTKIVSFWTKHLRLEWELAFLQVSGVTVEDTGIRFSHKGGRGGDKFILIPDKSAQSWFFDQIAGVVKAFNKRKKIERA